MIKVPNMSTPVYVKTGKDEEWPTDKMFYLLSSDGLFLCRNHEWFQSCSPAKRGPGELESQEAFAQINCPKIPKVLIEKAVGFFRHIWEKKHWESALILAWNRITKQIELVCPEQKCAGGSVEYDIPSLPQHMAIIGDIHSHCDFSPNASSIDVDDEISRPGLHIVVGYLNHKKPDFYCVVVIDGTRFEIAKLDTVMERFKSDGDFPEEWLEKVKQGTYTYSSNFTGGTGEYYKVAKAPSNQIDIERVKTILEDFMERKERPNMEEVRQELFRRTTSPSYLWCEDRAEKFVKEEWGKGIINEETATESSVEAENPTQLFS